MKGKLLYPLIITAILLTGCWDSINLENRGFIIGTAIDLAEKDNDAGEPTFTITNQLVIPSGVASNSQSGGQEKAFLNITSSGASIYRVDNELSALSSKAPYYQHLTILIISEDVARKKHLFSYLLDSYVRDVNLRRGVKVAVAKEDPNKLLEFTTPESNLPALHINELLEFSHEETGFFKPKLVGGIEESHLRKKSFILPLLEVSQYVEAKSGAVFHGPKDKMVGSFNTDEMAGLELMSSETPGKIVDFKYEGGIFAFEIIKMTNKLTVDPANIDNIKVTVNLELEGVIKESFSTQDLTKSKEIEAVQDAVNKEIKDLMEKTIHKAQTEFHADVFNIWKLLETKHYDTWQKIKNDWEEGKQYFTNVTFDVNVNTDIYSIGTSNKTR